MEHIEKLLSSVMPAGFSMETFLQALVLMIVGCIVLGLVGKFVFGERSALNGSVSAAIGILFIYAVTIVVHSTGVQLGFMLSPLPFVSLKGEYLTLFQFAGTEIPVICSELVNMVILAFTVNLIDNLMPRGEKLISWLLFRVLSVVLGTVAYTLVMWLVQTYVPDVLQTWAPVVLAVLLVSSLLVGSLKVVVGALIATVNPLIGILYTFFFATIVGKQLSKAMLTTLLLSALVFGLNYIGLDMIFIGVSALTAYIPLVAILLVLWWIVGKIL
jgi:hypothetical protein